MKVGALIKKWGYVRLNNILLFFMDEARSCLVSVACILKENR